MCFILLFVGLKKLNSNNCIDSVVNVQLNSVEVDESQKVSCAHEVDSVEVDESQNISDARIQIVGIGPATVISSIPLDEGNSFKLF